MVVLVDDSTEGVVVDSSTSISRFTTLFSCVSTDVAVAVVSLMGEVMDKVSCSVVFSNSTVVFSGISSRRCTGSLLCENIPLGAVS